MNIYPKRASTSGRAGFLSISSAEIAVKGKESDLNKVSSSFSMSLWPNYSIQINSNYCQKIYFFKKVGKIILFLPIIGLTWLSLGWTKSFSIYSITIEGAFLSVSYGGTNGIYYLLFDKEIGPLFPIGLVDVTDVPFVFYEELLRNGLTPKFVLVELKVCEWWKYEEFMLFWLRVLLE